MAQALGRSPDDYVVDSYRALFLQHREASGLTGTDMVFDAVRMAASELEAPPALLLTAGLGTRLRPLTYVRAKAAVPVNGDPLARRILIWLAGHGVRDLVLNLHHRPEIDDRGRRRRLRPRRPRPLLLGAAGARIGRRPATRAAAADGTAAASDSSSSTATRSARVDLAAMLRAHAASGALVTMALIPNPRPDKYGGVRLSDGGYVTGFTRRRQRRASRSTSSACRSRRRGRSRRSTTACRPNR